MRTLPLLILLATTCRADGAFGTWKMNPSRSALRGDPQPKTFTARFEAHPRGEVFTVDRVSGDGRATTSSVILYLDGKRRAFQNHSCSGTQSSQRLDSRTVEILLNCQDGRWVRLVRRLEPPARELILDIINTMPDGRRFASRLILERE